MSVTIFSPPDSRIHSRIARAVQAELADGYAEMQLPDTSRLFRQLDGMMMHSMHAFACAGVWMRSGAV